MKKIITLVIVLSAFIGSAQRTMFGSQNNYIGPDVPTLSTTTAATSISMISATSGGIVTTEGGSAVTARGTVWSVNPSPTIALTTKTIDGSGIGSFTSSITGLTQGTAYYVRAYATSEIGTGYGPEIIFMTTSTNVIIGTQTWSINNSDVTTYRDGTPIPQVTNMATFSNSTTGAWCYYNNDPTNGPIYGKIYNWYAIAGIYDAASLADPSLRKQFAPDGYHVPSSTEYSTLFTFLSNNGGKMKESGTAHWVTPNTGATNSSGFTALPTGQLSFDGSSFQFIGQYGYYWSSTPAAPQGGGPTAKGMRLDYNNTNILLSDFYIRTGLYVRCIKD